MIWDRDDESGVSFHIRKMLESSQTRDGRGGGHSWLNVGQRATLTALRDRLCDKGLPGTILADEVGMGKTRIAVALARAVTGAGRRAVLVVPPGLFHQWRGEFADVMGSGDVEPATILTIRSFHELLAKAPSAELKTSPVVILSHNLLNFQMKGGAASTVLVAQYAKLIKHLDGHSPDGKIQGAPLISDSEKEIIRNHLAYGQDLKPGDFQTKGNYDREAIISVALSFLGRFDLLVVDEAHKSKAADTPEQEGMKRSTLEKLLERLVRSNPRRLCMTATPFELDATNWKQILRRTGVTCEKELQACASASRDYSDAARAVRLDPSPEKAEAFAKAADQFQTCLSPWLLRRRKVVAGDNSPLERFVRDHGSHYRDRSKPIEADASGTIWPRAIMAVEALSLMPNTGLAAQRRVRLMLARNFSLAAAIEAASTDETIDRLPIEADEAEPEGTPTAKAQRRRARAQFWVNRLKPAAQNPYTHPTLLAAVKAIEDVTLGPSPEKVLVFGIYSQAIQRLTDLLNAREMIRRLIAFSPDTEQHFRTWHWPSETIQKDQAFNAALAAACEMDDIRNLMGVEKLESLLNKIPAQYEKYRSQRERTYNKVGEWVAKWLNPNETRSAKARNDLAARLTRALVDIIDDNPQGEIDDDTIKAAWSDFCQSLRSPQDDGEMDPGSREFRKQLEGALEDFGGRNGFFARRLVGGMEPATKQYLQSAFNRRSSWPMVLVAQSRVGREGLNLHRSCRTVVLFQPEWNPGVVEQQIGRVDRLASLWEEMVEQSGPEVEPPKIRIMPVKFPGTYDDHNWQVLQDRWDSYRAQMNGEVFAPDLANQEHLKEAIDLVRAATPDFAPPPLEAESRSARK
jgi:hypothetical protein